MHTCIYGIECKLLFHCLSDGFHIRHNACLYGVLITNKVSNQCFDLGVKGQDQMYLIFFYRCSYLAQRRSIKVTAKVQIIALTVILYGVNGRINFESLLRLIRRRTKLLFTLRFFIFAHFNGMMKSVASSTMRALASTRCSGIYLYS